MAPSAPNMQRGVVTASARPAPAAEPPQRAVTVRRPAEITPDTKLYRFVTDQAKNHMLKLVAYADDSAEDTALVEQAITDLGEPYIRFSAYAHVTPHKSVASLLMRRSRNDPTFHVWQDQESLLFRCPNCEEQFPNTKEGKDAFSRHMLERHLEVEEADA